MIFLADMGISPRTVAFLRELGHEALHLHDEGLDTLADERVLAKARSERRVLLTHDLDFGDLLAAGGAELPSVIIFRLRDMHPASVNRRLRQVIDRYEAELTKGAVLSVSESAVRVRALPIDLRS